LIYNGEPKKFAFIIGNYQYVTNYFFAEEDIWTNHFSYISFDFHRQCRIVYHSLSDVVQLHFRSNCYTSTIKIETASSPFTLQVDGRRIWHNFPRFGHWNIGF